MAAHASSIIRGVPQITGFLILLISITAWSFGYAETRYVAPDGAHVAPFTSWAMAATNIQGAVDAAVGGDTVLVTNGTYVLSSQIEVTHGITVVSVHGADYTILDGNDSNRCISLTHSNAVVDGFTISGGGRIWGDLGDESDGGGVACYQGTVQNCMITANIGSFGGGVWCSGGGTVRNSTISENVGYLGGGVNCSDGGTVENCTISGNSAEFGGGVEAVDGGTVENCTITGNSGGERGGGVRGGTVRNCTVSGNSAGFGGGVHVIRGTVDNCTITGNSAQEGGGVFISEGAVQNCIIFGNSALTHPNYLHLDEGWSITYCCTTPAVPGEGNIIDDPQFVEAAASDFQLSAMSPCIDAGNNQAWMVGATDLDGTPRIIGAAVDIGAYEWPYVVSFVDIKANGADDLVVLGRGEPLTVTASLVADPAIVGDTWVLALTSQAFPFNIFSYDLNLNSWVPWLYSFYSPSVRGAIPYLQSETLIQTNKFPCGFYIFYLGYDPVQNRRIDFDTLEIDAIPVIIGN